MDLSNVSITRKLSSSKLVKQFAELNFSDDVHAIDGGASARVENRFVFECSWEVANKGLFPVFEIKIHISISVGGIYTVLRTKAPVSTDELGDQYCMLGPYFEDRVKLEVEVLEPETAHMKYTLEQMQEWGFKVVYGRWLIDGYPKVVLFDIGSAAWKLDTWKHEVCFLCSHDSINNPCLGFSALRTV